MDSQPTTYDTYPDQPPQLLLKERWEAANSSRSSSVRLSVRRQNSSFSTNTTNTNSSSSSWRWRDVGHTPRPTALAVPQTSEARGSFAPTSPVFYSLRAFVQPPPRSTRRFRLTHPWSKVRAGETEKSGDVDSDATAPSSPESQYVDIPSICRTTSDSEPDDDEPSHVTKPLSHHWVPLARTPPAQRTPRSSSSPSSSSTPRANSSSNSNLKAGKSSKLAPELAEAERASRLRTSCQCSTCGRTGANFPTSPLSGEMWCSRECRVKARERRRAQAIAAHSG